MITEIQNPLNPEKLDAHQDHLAIDLHDKYGNEIVWQNVIGMLLPHFRAQLNQVINATYARRGAETERQNSPLTPREIDQLCASVDQIFVTHKALLDVEGDFKPVKKAMVGIRKKVRAELLEEFFSSCRRALEQQGITDREQLLDKGSAWFTKTSFPPHESGRMIAKEILGQSFEYVPIEALHRIADVLGFSRPPKLNKEQLSNTYRAALSAHGIVDRPTLLACGPNYFRTAQFPPYGGGFTFLSLILGETIRGVITYDILNRLAEKVGFPEITIQTLRLALAAHNIFDQQTLEQVGTLRFREMHFPPFGYGTAYAAAVLGETIGSVTSGIISRVGRKLKLPVFSEQQKTIFRNVLASKGIYDRNDLIRKGNQWFENEEFPPYGKGPSFCGHVLHQNVRHITDAVIKAVADKLGW